MYKHLKDLDEGKDARVLLLQASERLRRFNKEEIEQRLTLFGYALVVIEGRVWNVTGMDSLFDCKFFAMDKDANNGEFYYDEIHDFEDNGSF